MYNLVHNASCGSRLRLWRRHLGVVCTVKKKLFEQHSQVRFSVPTSVGNIVSRFPAVCPRRCTKGAYEVKSVFEFLHANVPEYRLRGRDVFRSRSISPFAVTFTDPDRTEMLRFEELTVFNEFAVPNGKNVDFEWTPYE